MSGELVTLSEQASPAGAPAAAATGPRNVMPAGSSSLKPLGAGESADPGLDLHIR
jgi:hypothetical protein